jgi:hypothetical protein
MFIDVEEFDVLMDDIFAGERTVAFGIGELGKDYSHAIAIVKKLGCLSRDHEIRLGPNEAGILHRSIEAACNRRLLGQLSRTKRDLVNDRLMELTFFVGDAANWAMILSTVRDGDRERVLRLTTKANRNYVRIAD